MARIPRMVSYELPMHVMNRGNNRQQIFFSADEQRYFRYLLHNMKGANRVDIYHYCLMNNHIHLIVRLNPSGNLSRFLKQVFLAYHSYFKRRHEYIGHLVQGRFKSIIIETEEYLLQCGKYIEMNPVRAKIVSRPGDYKFSSYNSYAQSQYDPLVTPNPCFTSLGKDERERRSAYRSLFIDTKVINREKLRSQLYLGSDMFIKRMESAFGIKNVGLKRGRPKMKK
jgi:REP-associated tyrosine transposase